MGTRYTASMSEKDFSERARAGETMEAEAGRLYECAVKGDIPVFRRLVQQDDGILERLTIQPAGKGFVTSKEIDVLHVVASYGHARFVETVLSYRPELSTQSDRDGLTVLHVAASGGNVETCRVILQADPDTALSKDNGGRIPAHLAAMKGKLGPLQEILEVHPWCVKDRTANGESILHLSVKYNRLEVVMFLLGLKEVQEMVNAGDGNGNTILHLAAARKQKEMLNALLGSGLALDLNAVNAFGVNPYDLFCARWRPATDDDFVDRLRPSREQQHQVLAVEAASTPDHLITPPYPVAVTEGFDLWTKQTDTLMLVAILIATVTFQAALTPPGGFWQDSGSTGTDSYTAAPAPAPALDNSHTAGTVILDHGPYDRFMNFNTGAFLFAMLALLFHPLMQTSFFPKASLLLGWATNMAMALIYFAIALYYGIEATQPKGNHATGGYLGLGVGVIIAWLVILFGVKILLSLFIRLRSFRRLR